MLKRIYKIPDLFGIENLETEKLVEKYDLEPAMVEGDFSTVTATDKKSDSNTTLEEDLEEIARQDPDFKKDWDPVYGDRMQKLVIIGRKMDRAAITKLFNDCLE